MTIIIHPSPALFKKNNITANLLGLPENLLSGFIKNDNSDNYTQSDSNLFSLDLNFKENINYSISYDPLTCLQTVQHRRILDSSLTSTTETKLCTQYDPIKKEWSASSCVINGNETIGYSCRCASIGQPIQI
jgi:hypothetical protein